MVFLYNFVSVKQINNKRNENKREKIIIKKIRNFGWA